MGFWSTVCSVVSDTVSAVASVASKVVSKVKDIAVKTVNWMADKAESFVGTVKSIWKAVKPYIGHARVALAVLAEWAPWPIVKVMALGLERALGFIENIESHPLMDKLKKAIDWAIRAAKEVREKVLNEQEIQEAEARSEVFKESIRSVPEAEREALEVAALINSYLLVKAKTLKVVNSGEFEDFNHYLRIRAAQKLLGLYEKQMTTLQSLSGVGADMVALMDISSSLLARDPSLSEEQTNNLNELTTLHFGKPVVPFVFEEMILAWNLELTSIEKEWEDLNRSLARDRVLLKRLTLAARDEPLSPEEQVMMNDLNLTIGRESIKLKNLENETREKRSYIFAAEGFLQLLEKDEQTLIDEGLDYLTERGEEVGALIIRCAQQGVRWHELSEDEQALITDFANIFEEDCRARTHEFTEVEVSL